MNKHIVTIFFGALIGVSSVAMAIMPFNVDPQVRSTNYSNFMRQYPNPEYQIITPNNMISMDWLRGAAAAVFYDGYTTDNDIAMVLWRHMTNVVNFVAQRYPNQEEVKTRLWQALTRSIDELRRQGMQQQQVRPTYTPSTPYAAPIVSAPQRPLPSTPSTLTTSTMPLTKEGILNGALGSDYAAKLREVLNYNDARSIKAGLIPLANAITTDIDNINEENTPRETKVMDLKRRIDAIHTKMVQRRARD
jgi:hypothetical protein